MQLQAGAAPGSLTPSGCHAAAPKVCSSSRALRALLQLSLLSLQRLLRPRPGSQLKLPQRHRLWQYPGASSWPPHVCAAGGSQGCGDRRFLLMGKQMRGGARADGRIVLKEIPAARGGEACAAVWHVEGLHCLGRVLTIQPCAYLPSSHPSGLSWKGHRTSSAGGRCWLSHAEVAAWPSPLALPSSSQA